ncbi:MAG TPA: RidA family protein [Acidimicrobiia bacterium]
MRDAINPPSLPPPPGYSQVVRISRGTTIYIAGQVAWDEEGNLVGAGDFEAQTRQVFANLVAALHSASADVADLVKIGIYVVDHDPEKLDVIRRVRNALFGDITPPASTLLGVSVLAVPGLMIEVDGVAFVED